MVDGLGARFYGQYFKAAEPVDWFARQVAVGETVILLHLPLPLVDFQ